jgi:hypothetical protein
MAAATKAVVTWAARRQFGKVNNILVDDSIGIVWSCGRILQCRHHIDAPINFVDQRAQGFWLGGRMGELFVCDLVWYS